MLQLLSNIHSSTWICFLLQPLIMSNDLRKISPEAKAILQNKYVCKRLTSSFMFNTRKFCFPYRSCGLLSKVDWRCRRRWVAANFLTFCFFIIMVVKGIWQVPEEGIGVGNEEERYTGGNGESSDEFVWRCKDRVGLELPEEFDWDGSWCAPGIRIVAVGFLRTWLTWLRRVWEMKNKDFRKTCQICHSFLINCSFFKLLTRKIFSLKFITNIKFSLL